MARISDGWPTRVLLNKPVANMGVEQKSIVAFVSTGPTVRVGGFLLRELEDGSLWIENEIGEGMQVNPHHLETCLRLFMVEQF